EAEASVLALVKHCRRQGVPVILETDPATASSAWQLYPLLRTAGTALLLAPYLRDLLPTHFAELPRASRREHIPGRGFWLSAAGAEEVQLVLPAPGDERLRVE